MKAGWSVAPLALQDLVVSSLHDSKRTLTYEVVITIIIMDFINIFTQLVNAVSSHVLIANLPDGRSEKIIFLS